MCLITTFQVMVALVVVELDCQEVKLALVRYLDILLELVCAPLIDMKKSGRKG